jgi:formiminoglutamase
VRALLADGLPGANIVQIGIQPFANSPAYAAVAREAGIEVLTADQVIDAGIADVVRRGLEGLSSRADRVYVDFDLDVLDKAFAPAAPGSRPGGLAPWALRRAARMCGAHRGVYAMDLVEIDPTRDIADATSLAAAACLLEFAAGVLSRVEAG